MEKILIIDTETTNDLTDSLVYDCGFIVADYNGKIYSKHSFVNADIFCDKELMASAYFAEKIPTYWKEIKSGLRTLTSFRNIMWTLRHIMKENNITKVYAYNCRFDYLALATTQRNIRHSQIVRLNIKFCSSALSQTDLTLRQKCGRKGLTMKIYIVTYATEFEVCLTYDTKVFKSKAKAKKYLNSINEYGEFEIFEYKTED